ncbi:MAG: rhodanese-like domain-containing protein, partial [Magnetococcales bacterium]|nr:rhodanese-like domain-containing protein [Magnetococcales bacterium]
MIMKSAPHSPSHPKLGHLTPKEALEFIQENKAVFVDIRSEMEHFFVGHPMGVVNIPWQDAPDFEINPNFADEVGRVANKEQPIVLICR